LGTLDQLVRNVAIELGLPRQIASVTTRISSTHTSTTQEAAIAVTHVTPTPGPPSPVVEFHHHRSMQILDRARHVAAVGVSA
jgi:hypothetical protein